MCPSCASSGSCLPCYIIREPQEHRPTRSQSSCNLCTSVSHMMLDIIDPLNKSTTQRAPKQPFLLEKNGTDWNTNLNLLHGYVAKKTMNLWRRKIQNTAESIQICRPSGAPNGSSSLWIYTYHTILGDRALTINILCLFSTTTVSLPPLCHCRFLYSPLVLPNLTRPLRNPRSPKDRADTTHPCLLSTLTSGGSREN